MINDIIIRSSGERTKDVCTLKWQDMYPDANVHVLNIHPFTDALRATYDIGQSSTAPWCIVTDADIIPYDHTNDHIVDILSNASDDVFLYNCGIYDWLMGKTRSVGIKLYRTSAFHELINMIGYGHVRPECHVLNSYHATISHVIKVLGVHDKKQYYRDIYRKVRHHMTKHADHMTDMKSYWNSVHHPDFLVALASLDYKVKFDPCDSTTFPDISKLLDMLGLEEKEPIDTDEIQ